ncbi:uncharacterized protein LOC124208432 isoform X2 [Daphnia pulex]|nr:uncharacterized protein LOC124208432 isoform X2 [Daphnia pulex]XP_046640093.1 uncharacterized protein LOC124321226 isoform X2 [Daphnia pulicaria]
MDNLYIALNKEFEIPIDNLEVYLEKTCAVAAERPLDEKIIRILKKLSALLWQRYQISRGECSELQCTLSEELLLNSERLRTLTILRRDEKKYQERLQKNSWLLERVRERGRTHIRIAREAQDLKRYVEEQKETIVQLKKDINRLKKKCGRQNRPSSQNYRVG